MVFIFCSALWLYDVQMNVMNANRVENDVAHLGKIDKFLWRERERERKKLKEKILASGWFELWLCGNQRTKSPLTKVWLNSYAKIVQNVHLRIVGRNIKKVLTWIMTQNIVNLMWEFGESIFFFHLRKYFTGSDYIPERKKNLLGARIIS